MRFAIASAFLALGACVPWTVRPIEQTEKAFDAARYVESIWDSRVVTAGSLSKGEGRVLRVDADALRLEGDVVVKIGPVIRGTALRDALAFIQFSQFVNQLEFARVANALNERAAKVAQAAMPKESAVGATARYKGAAVHTGGVLEIVPVALFDNQGETMTLAASGVSMQYPGTLALDRVDFTVQPGRVNALIGENGAGKSTLVRILAGEERPTAGHLEVDCSVAMIHQELNLLPNLSVSDNIFLGRERTRRGVIDWRAQAEETRGLMTRLGQPIDPDTLVGDLPLGRQQMVEIAKALARDARVLIMDEPTSALSAAEIGVLFALIRDLKSQGVAIVYISHRLEELLTIGDHVTVLRDGRIVASSEVASISTEWLVEQMWGRPPGLPSERSERPPRSGPPTLRASTFTAQSGEILGFYGLLGAGRTEFFEALMSARGSIAIEGREIGHLDTAARIRAGLAMVPEERKAAGIVPTMTVLENITLATVRGLYLSPESERRRAEPVAADLGVRLTGPITALSGGNQQKAVLARYLLAAPKVLLLDEPTRGVDIAARAEIYAVIRRLASQGMTVLFASSDLQEVLTLADRILVMSRGRIAAEFDAGAATEHALIAASGGAS